MNKKEMINKAHLMLQNIKKLIGEYNAYAVPLGLSEKIFSGNILEDAQVVTLRQQNYDLQARIDELENYTDDSEWSSSMWQGC